MNCATSGSFSFMWLWEHLSHCRSGWGEPRARLPIMMSDALLQMCCFVFRGKEGTCLNCHCDEETRRHEWEAPRSSSPVFLVFKSAWHACEHARHGRETSPWRISAVSLAREGGASSPHGCKSGRTVRLHGRPGQLSRVLAKSSVRTGVELLWGPRRNSTPRICLCKALL